MPGSLNVADLLSVLVDMLGHVSRESRPAHERGQAFAQPDRRSVVSSNRNRAVLLRRSPALVALGATAAIAAAAWPGVARAAEPSASRPGTGNVVVEWNHALLSAVQTPGAEPATIHPTRAFAIMSLAVLDAVDAVSSEPAPHPLRFNVGRRAAQDAAAAQAAHDVLTALFPTLTEAHDAELAADLAAIPPGYWRTAGTRLGAHAAADVLRARADDGSSATAPPYQSTGDPGDYRPTPPDEAAPVFTHWAAVRPFVLRDGSQFRPPPPPALSSPAYAAAVNEVKGLGQDHSTTRTSEQTTIGRFWSAPIQNYWNAIAEQVALAHHDSTAASARTFALLDIGLADTTIALYDAKYAFRLWRPISAIRLAGTDGNAQTTADQAWTPLAGTPADPSYPGAHSALSAAAATILAFAYGDASFTVSSPTLPGVTRSFASFDDAAAEAGLSRIYAGVHTRLDHTSGLTLGSHVARYTLGNAPINALGRNHE